MKPETRKWIGEYVAVLPPGGIVSTCLDQFKEVKAPKKELAITIGLMLFLESTRAVVATAPIWGRYVTGEEFGTGDNEGYEKLVIYSTSALAYLTISSLAAWTVQRSGEYCQQRAAINRLYPPKIHSTNEQGQGKQSGPGDLEKRL